MPEPAIRKRGRVKPTSPFASLGIIPDEDAVPAPVPDAPQEPAEPAEPAQEASADAPEAAPAPVAVPVPPTLSVVKPAASAEAQVGEMRALKKGSTAQLNNRIAIELDQRMKAYADATGYLKRDIIEAALHAFLKNEGF